MNLLESLKKKQANFQLITSSIIILSIYLHYHLIIVSYPYQLYLIVVTFINLTLSSPPHYHYLRIAALVVAIMLTKITISDTPMLKAIFIKLQDFVFEYTKLRSSLSVTIEEKLAIFLYIVTKGCFLCHIA